MAPATPGESPASLWYRPCAIDPVRWSVCRRPRSRTSPGRRPRAAEAGAASLACRGQGVKGKWGGRRDPPSRGLIPGRPRSPPRSAKSPNVVPSRLPVDHLPAGCPCSSRLIESKKVRGCVLSREGPAAATAGRPRAPFPESSTDSRGRVGDGRSPRHQLFQGRRPQDSPSNFTKRSEAGPPHVPAWIDKRDLAPGRSWDTQIPEMIRDCASLIFVMSRDSVEDQSICKPEWSKALRAIEADRPHPVSPRRGPALPPGEPPVHRVHRAIRPGPASHGSARTWPGSSPPPGQLQALKDRLADARRRPSPAPTSLNSRSASASTSPSWRRTSRLSSESSPTPKGRRGRPDGKHRGGPGAWRRPEKPVGASRGRSSSTRLRP